MLIRRSGVLAALVAALFVAGCARSTTGSDSTGTPGATGSVSSGAPGPDGSTSAGATGSVSRGTPGSAPPSEEPTGTKPPAATGSETLSGTVTAGVEPHCLLLTGNGPAHLLLFEDPSLRSK